jgi:hypothetical protein
MRRGVRQAGGLSAGGWWWNVVASGGAVRASGGSATVVMLRFRAGTERTLFIAPPPSKVELDRLGGCAGD